MLVSGSSRRAKLGLLAGPACTPAARVCRPTSPRRRGDHPSGLEAGPIPCELGATAVRGLRAAAAPSEELLPPVAGQADEWTKFAAQARADDALPAASETAETEAAEPSAELQPPPMSSTGVWELFEGLKMVAAGARLRRRPPSPRPRGGWTRTAYRSLPQSCCRRPPRSPTA